MPLAAIFSGEASMAKSAMEADCVFMTVRARFKNLSFGEL